MRGRTFDLITIGMGVHWLGEAVLEGLRRNLKPGGRIAILATGISGPSYNPWFADFHRVRGALTQPEKRDWTGEAQLSALGYFRADLLEKTYRGKVSPTDLVNHLLSFSEEAQIVSKNYDAVLAAVEKALKPYLSNGWIDCCWTSSARLFVDQKSTAIPLSTQSP